MSTPGTYRSSDGSAVTFPQALDAWTTAAVDVLTDRARTYNATIGYADLRDALFARSGIETRTLLPHWIGKVLGKVADTCHATDGLPPLTALVIHEHTGTVGPGYADAVQRNTGAVPDDIEEHAADARLECYRALARDLPADGGRPALTARLKAARRAAAPTPPAPTCGNCNVTLPRSGQCDNCT